MSYSPCEEMEEIDPLVVDANNHVREVCMNSSRRYYQGPQKAPQKYPYQLQCLETGNYHKEKWRLVEIGGNKPGGRIGHSVNVGDDGMVYVWGGCLEIPGRGSKYLDDFFRFNPQTKLWENIPVSGEKPAGRAFHSSILYNGKILIFGGCNGKGRFNDTYFINPNGHCERLVTGGVPPNTRYCHSAVLFNNKLIVFGGKCGGRNSNKRLADMFSLDMSTLTWEAEDPSSTSEDPPTSRSAHTALIYHGKMILFGGRNADGKCCDDVYEYYFSTAEWKCIHSGLGPYARARHSAVLHNEKLFIFGGWNGKKKLNDLVQYNLDTQIFQLLHESDESDLRLPCRRECHTAVVVNRKMLLIGGRFRGEFKDDAYEFDLDPPTLKELCNAKLNNKFPPVSMADKVRIPRWAFNIPTTLCEQLVISRNKGEPYEVKKKIQHEFKRRKAKSSRPQPKPHPPQSAPQHVVGGFNLPNLYVQLARIEMLSPPMRPPQMHPQWYTSHHHHHHHVRDDRSYSMPQVYQQPNYHQHHYYQERHY